MSVLPRVSGIVDVHVHGAPSLVPRHMLDTDQVADNRDGGIAVSVLKAHEGSTVERAILAGEGAVGGIVLNAPVGGANADAVNVAAQLGGRVVWLPTASSSTHARAADGAQLSVLARLRFSPVPVLVGRSLRPEWHEILDIVAAHDMVLASGHLACAETLIVFAEARRRGVRRLLVNHPLMPFLGWEPSMGAEFSKLGAYLELAILPDLLQADRSHRSVMLVGQYPTELFVFGSDLGHASHPPVRTALPTWFDEMAAAMGASQLVDVMTTNGRNLVLNQGARASEATA